VAELRQKDQALVAKESELQGKEAELQDKETVVTTLAKNLVQKDVLLAAQEVAVRDAMAALKEGKASLSGIQERANAERAQLEEAQECIKGKYLGFFA